MVSAVVPLAVRQVPMDPPLKMVSLPKAAVPAVELYNVVCM